MPTVVVIGAGMAGLQTARLLAKRGVRVVVLEKNDRSGGRMQTARVGAAYERGAWRVRGERAEALIRELGGTLRELRPRPHQEAAVSDATTNVLLA